MKNTMFKAFPATNLSVEEKNITMLSYGLSSLLESLNLNEGWNEGEPHSIILQKLLELQLEINSLRETFSSNL